MIDGIGVIHDPQPIDVAALAGRITGAEVEMFLKSLRLGPAL